MRPRARDKGLVVRRLSDEVLVYDAERHEAHCLNRTAALVWERCDGQRSVAEIAESVARALGQPVDENLVLVALERLEAVGLVAAEPAPLRCSRRELARHLARAGQAGAMCSALLPAVTSVLAPTAAQAASFHTVRSRLRRREMTYLERIAWNRARRRGRRNRRR